jgi:hypothetical protein
MVIDPTLFDDISLRDTGGASTALVSPECVALL